MTSLRGCPSEPEGTIAMIEWSESDLLIRDAMREFIDKEVRPNIDALESGDMPPYPIIRKLFSRFGVDVMAAEAVKTMLDRQRAKESGSDDATEARAERGLGGMAEQASMAAIVVAELAGVSLGAVAALGVSIGLGAATIMQRGTLAQKERWLPQLMTMEKV